MAATELRSGAITAAAALVAGPPRTTPAQATAGDRILPPPSLFSLTSEPPSRPDLPARAAAGEPPLPPLFFGWEEGEEGKNAQSPLASFLFI